MSKPTQEEMKLAEEAEKEWNKRCCCNGSCHCVAFKEVVAQAIHDAKQKVVKAVEKAYEDSFSVLKHLRSGEPLVEAARQAAGTPDQHLSTNLSEMNWGPLKSKSKE